MVNNSAPSISLTGVDEDRVYAGSVSQTPLSSMARNIPPISSSPASSGFEASQRENIAFSPLNPALVEPQAMSLSGDMFSLSSDVMHDHNYQSNVFEHSDPVQLSSSLLSAHSATAAGSVGSTTGARVRSGSLFSTNSIWNDDNLPHNSPDRSISSGCGVLPDVFAESSIPLASSSKPSSASFLSPNLVPQASPFGFANHSRNRSHTTSGSIHGPGVQKVDAFRSNLSPLLHSTQDDPSLPIDNLYLNSHEGPAQGTRNRSQTYSGVQPKIPSSALPPMGTGSSAQSSQSASQNFPTFQNNGQTHSSIGQAQYESSHVSSSNSGPLLQDSFNFRDLSITTSFEVPSLGPTNTLLIDNVPRFLTAAKLYQLLSSPTGMLSGFHNRGILSVRLTSAGNSKMALVVCLSVEIAMNIKANFNHLEVVPGVILYAAFARVVEKNDSANISPASSASFSQAPSSQVDQVEEVPVERPAATSRKPSVDRVSDYNFSMVSQGVFATCMRLSGSMKVNIEKVSSLIDSASKYPKENYRTSFDALPEPSASRQFDAPKIRELRKSLEANEKALQKRQSSDSDDESKALSQTEIESLAVAMLEELPELCYDHIGNTIVQKIFTVIESPKIKLRMVKQIIPYLAQLGIHKNGTWAIQKIINSSQGESDQMSLIAESLRPFSSKLFNDQFGNYVLQCCLKFGSPYNDFIFEAICNNFTEICSGRFGVRCVRTILESVTEAKSGINTITQEQLALVAGLILEHANELVLNNNGSLLITWFLDTFSGFKIGVSDQRPRLLCEKLIPNLDKLCTHKLANVTVSKLLSNRSDSNVRFMIMDSIFSPFIDSVPEASKPPSDLLESILRESNDNAAGPMFIQKVLSNSSFFAIGDEHLNQRYQQFAISQVKRVLLEMHIANLQPYKKLLDEVGLSNGRISRPTSGNRKSKRGSGNSRSGQANQPFHYGMVNYPQMHAGQQMGIPMGYGNVPNETQVYYTPFGPALNGVGIPMNSAQASNPSYFDMNSGGAPMDSQYNQDAQVMRQLEQLSLQSAAMGYASNPGTPGAGINNHNQNSFF